MFLLLIACICVSISGLAFLEAVRAASIVPENGTAPTRYISNSLFLVKYVYVTTMLLLLEIKMQFLVNYKNCYKGSRICHFMM